MAIRLNKSYGLYMLFALAIFYWVLTYVYVRKFYEVNLPHYDSMGSYTLMFHIIGSLEKGDLIAAISIAASNFLSWLQGFFPIIFFWFLDKTPESVQILNCGSSLIAAISIYLCAKKHNASEGAAFIASTLIYIPDIFYDWWSGMLDMRRDFSFIAFLIAFYFYLFLFIKKPSKKNAVLLGLLGSATVYSRDSAIVYLVLFSVPGVLFYFYENINGLRSAIKKIIPTLVVFTSLTFPYFYLNYALILDRRFNPFVMFSGGLDFITSMQINWSKPFSLLFGSLGNIPTGNYGWPLLNPAMSNIGAEFSRDIFGFRTLPLSLLFLSSLFILSFLTISSFRLDSFKAIFRELPVNRFILSGLWTLLVTYTLMVAWYGHKEMGSMIDFMPTLVCFFSIGFYFITSLNITFTYKKFGFAFFITIYILLLIWISILKIESKAPQSQVNLLPVARQLAKIVNSNSSLDKNSVAYLWHDGISIDTLYFYNAIDGIKSNFKKFTFTFNGRSLDYAVTVPVGVSHHDMLNAFELELIQKAKFIIINNSPDAYNQKNSEMFLFKYGKPAVDKIISDPRMKKIHEYQVNTESFSIYERVN